MKTGHTKITSYAGNVCEPGSVPVVRVADIEALEAERANYKDLEVRE